MLVIRDAQMRAFEYLTPQAFDERMVEHIGRHFPKHAAILSPEELREVIRSGRERADELNFKALSEASLFVDLRIILGHGFEDDPQLPWVSPILAASADDPRATIKRLHATAMSYLDRVVGLDEVFPVMALRKGLGYPMDQMDRSLTQGFAKGVLLEFHAIWRRKYLRVGPQALAQLVRQGSEAARNRGFTVKRNIGYFLLLRFLLGHQCDTDPQYPWFAVIAGDPQASNEAFRFDCLYNMSQAALAQALSA